MSDTSFFLSELTEVGLMAAGDPVFAERLIDALQRLPARQDAEHAGSAAANGSAGGDSAHAALER